MKKLYLFKNNEEAINKEINRKSLVFIRNPRKFIRTRSGGTIKSENNIIYVEAPAEDTIPNNQIWYTTSDNLAITVNTYNGVLQFGTASIVSNTYENGKGIITFDQDITTIGTYALYYQTTLTSITIPSTVTTIGNEAIRECSSLATVNIPDSVSSIGEYSFMGSLITAIKIPASMNVIGKQAFYGMEHLTNIIWHNNVTSIEQDAFYSCSSLVNVSIPNSVTTVGMSAFRYCNIETLQLGKNLTNIYDGAFGSNSSTLHTVIYNEGIETLYSLAKITSFGAGNVTTVVIPQSAKIIPNGCFSNCNKLSNINLNTSHIELIGQESFSTCISLPESLIIPDTVTSIGYQAFNNCSSIKSLTIGNGLKNIELRAFAGLYNLENLTLKQGIETIGNYAFYNTPALKSVSFPSSVVSIGDYAFTSGVESISFNEGLLTIGMFAFMSATVKTLIFPSTLIRIGQSAFANCRLLSVATLGTNVQEIAVGAFSQSSIKVIIYAGTEEQWNNIIKGDNAAFYNSITVIFNGLPATDYVYQTTLQEKVTVSATDTSTTITYNCKVIQISTGDIVLNGPVSTTVEFPENTDTENNVVRTGQVECTVAGHSGHYLTWTVTQEALSVTPDPTVLSWGTDNTSGELSPDPVTHNYMYALTDNYAAPYSRSGYTGTPAKTYTNLRFTRPDKASEVGYYGNGIDGLIQCCTWNTTSATYAGNTQVTGSISNLSVWKSQGASVAMAWCDVSFARYGNDFKFGAPAGVTVLGFCIISGHCCNDERYSRSIIVSEPNSTTDDGRPAYSISNSLFYDNSSNGYLIAVLYK